MKKKQTIFKLSVLILHLLLTPVYSLAQRPMEKLDRSVNAQKVAGGVYVNWRINSDEWYNTSYRLYRNGTFIYETGTTGASNYLDAAGTTSSQYSVTKVKNGIESAQSIQSSVNSKAYIEIPMRDIKPLGKLGYYLNDATTADLDGDGQYEIIIKRMNRDWSVGNTSYTYFEAYKLDGTFMWAIDVGPNITMDVEIDIAAFDFDGDGKAEVFMRSSDGTVFGLDKNNLNGTPVGDRDGDGVINYRYSIDQTQGMGFMNAGPEYISLIDGVTGKELDWKNFIPRGNSNDWGDGYGHRANKFYFGAPYLDGKHPSLFIGRGIYTQTKMQTYDVVNKKLVPRWYWEVLTENQLFKGKWDDSPKKYFAQGYHNYTIADVDDDGKDEINWGSMTIDDDGTPLYSTELGHGDAQHYGDFDPYHKGIEVFACNEEKPGTNLREGKTGKILYRHVTPTDCGRACAGNISDAYKGAEVWGGGVAISATDRTDLTHFGVAENYAVYWDGDLLQELCDHSGFTAAKGVGNGAITKFNGYGNISTLLTAEANSCNYTKGTPCLQADLLGDWREEEVWWRSDSMALRIYTTPYPTTNRIYTLMHDPQYRQAICWQMCGYNQPPHTSFYLGSDFPTPIPAKSTNGKLVWNGASANWDTSSKNWFDGDDAAGLLAEKSTAIAYANGKSVLFDSHATTNSTVNIPANLSPEVLTVSGSTNYTISGAGTLAGAMHLDKMGEGSLTLNGTHSYTGTTDIWEGDFIVEGTLSASLVNLRRFAALGGKGKVSQGINMEYGSILYPGGSASAGTITIGTALTLKDGAVIKVDLSANPTSIASPNQNDYIIIDGNMVLGNNVVVSINPTSGVITEGDYILAQVSGTVTGNLTNIIINGVLGKKANLVLESGKLILRITGVRDAASTIWNGGTTGVWDVSTSANWLNGVNPDIFVYHDNVTFNDAALLKTVTMTGILAPADIKIDNNSAAYTFDGTGSITGTTGLYKTNKGEVTLNTRNDFTGKTIVDGGSLIMKYAPSTTSNGGIGTNNADPDYLVVKDSANIQVTTANEITSRGLTLSGTAGGLMNVSSALYWNGVITGTKLTKYGSGTLYIGNNNSTLNETVLKAGIIKLNMETAVPYGIGKKITLLGGTLETLNGIGLYLTSSNAFDVPSGSTATVIAGARCEYNGALTGAGTLNWNCDYIRANMNGNWSAFTGNLNISANAANSTSENRFIVNNSNGFPNANITLGTGVIMCYKNGSANDGTATIKVGMLNGTGTLFNAGLEVGGTNQDGTFNGIISGVSNVNKAGIGTWTLTGTNTYTGSTNVNSGTLTLNGSIVGTGNITIANTATMNLIGTVAGSISIASGGTLSLTGVASSNITNTGTLSGTGTIQGSVTLSDNSNTIPGNASIGTLTFGSNLTMNNNAALSMQVVGGSANCDKLSVAGTLSCNGSLNVSLGSGSLALGDTYQLYTAASITGAFTAVNLPALNKGLEWDKNELYTTGTIKIKLATGLKSTETKIGVKQNPTTGLFQIYMNQSASNRLAIITDLQGKIVYQSDLSRFGDWFDIDLSSQNNGVYLLKIISDKENSNVIKLIKK